MEQTDSCGRGGERWGGKKKGKGLVWAWPVGVGGAGGRGAKAEKLGQL